LCFNPRQHIAGNQLRVIVPPTSDAGKTFRDVIATQGGFGEDSHGMNSLAYPWRDTVSEAPARRPLVVYTNPINPSILPQLDFCEMI
jgi:hypothetical protein